MKYLLSFSVIILLFSCKKESITYTNNPEDANFIFEDLPRFWTAYERLTKELLRKERTKIFKEAYTDKASFLLQKYWDSKGGLSMDKYLDAIANNQVFFNSIKESTLAAQTYEPEFYEIYNNLKECYEAAVFPDMVFAIGFFENGGRAFSEGLYIGCEIRSVSEQADLSSFSDNYWLKKDSLFKPPSELKFIVAHELVHFQQDISNKHVLARSINEGAADFIGEIISGGHTNAKLVRDLDPIEKEVWIDFQKDMLGTNYHKWFSTNNTWPKDAGYYMGYKICAHYYSQQVDKKAAINTILNIKDTEEFLNLSGYRDKF